MSSAEDQPGAPRLAAPRPDRAVPYELTRLHSVLDDVLCVIDGEARQLDASLGDTHELVRDIRTLLSRLRSDSTSVDYAQRRAYDNFEHARVTENEAYEVFAGDLERFMKRQRLNLGVVELDSDKRALVQRRREYIATLRACQSRVSAIVTARLACRRTFRRS